MDSVQSKRAVRMRKRHPVGTIFFVSREKCKNFLIASVDQCGIYEDRCRQQWESAQGMTEHTLTCEVRTKHGPSVRADSITGTQNESPKSRQKRGNNP